MHRTELQILEQQNNNTAGEEQNFHKRWRKILLKDFTHHCKEKNEN